MAEKLGLDGEVHELKLGRSFDTGSGSGPVGYHSIRYDFKPASVDTSKMACVDVGEGNSISVNVPHIEGSGTSHTVYKGNKRPCQKECVLIIDHKTGEFTLEKLATNIQLKKTRMPEGSRPSQMPRPATPTETKVKVSPGKKSQPSSSSQHSTHQPPQLHRSNSKQEETKVPEAAPSPGSLDISDTSSSDSNSSDSDDSDSDKEPTPTNAKPAVVPTKTPESSSHFPSARPDFLSTLSEDLQLSESGSDSD